MTGLPVVEKVLRLISPFRHTHNTGVWQSSIHPASQPSFDSKDGAYALHRAGKNGRKLSNCVWNNSNLVKTAGEVDQNRLLSLQNCTSNRLTGLLTRMQWWWLEAQPEARNGTFRSFKRALHNSLQAETGNIYHSVATAIFSSILDDNSVDPAVADCRLSSADGGVRLGNYW